ncbi:MAG TPA: imidazolonepropionase [Bacteroidales bacterium]|nr:imidazolonepropionase [Bacteroidales bacterium]HRZ49336.1 imidazolonepropionase [Bacteroidales bacterium]
MANRSLLTHIGLLAGIIEDGSPFLAGESMAVVNTIENAWLLMEDGMISDYGSMDSLPPRPEDAISQDCSGRIVMPAFCDSHTHLVFAGTREIEYVDKIKGLSYEEIAKRGGGILNSAARMAEISGEKLLQQSLERLDLIQSYGTGAVEIKSGYGLNTASELKMLRVIKQMKMMSPLTIKATFLGAHAIPQEYRGNPDKYVEVIVNEMIPAVAEENLADYVDVFCDKGFFTVPQTERILSVAGKYGLIPKIHANELGFSGGIQTGVKYKALSVDHMEYTGDAEIRALRGSRTMPTLLPGAAFFLGMVDPPARKMIEAGLPLAMASDFNPGSSPSGNMQLIWSFGCIKLRLTPDEAFNAITINSAYAMGVEQELGSITRGKRASLIITKPVPNLAYMPYAYGDNKVWKTLIS